MATSIRFTVPGQVKAEQPEEPRFHPLVAFEQQRENRIDVADDLSLSDVLVLKTQRLLNKGKRDTGGLIPAPAGGLHIHTSKALHNRALRILQALITGFEQAGLPRRRDR